MGELQDRVQRGDVDQAGVPVGGEVLLGQRVAEAHLLEHGELDLEELDRHPLHGDLGVGHDRRGEQGHRLDRVLARRVVDVHGDVGAAGDHQGGRADALDLHAELAQEEAQVLDHVVGAGVADDRGAVTQGRGHQGVLGDGVAALDQHDRARRDDARLDHGVIAALGRLHLQPEGTQRGHVRLDGPGAEVAASGVRQLEVARAVHQRAEEHDDRAGTTGRGLVDPAEVEVRRRGDLEVVLGVQPAELHAQALQHLEQPVDLLDAGDPAQRRTATVEQGGAEQGDPGVLGGLDLDGAAQRRRSGHPEVGGALADAHQG